MLSARDVNITVDIGSHVATTLIIIWFNRTHVSLYIISIIIIIVERTVKIYIMFSFWSENTKHDLRGRDRALSHLILSLNPSTL